MPYWSTSGLHAHEQTSYWGDVVCEAFTPLAPRRRREHIDASANPDGLPGWVRSEPLDRTNCAEIASCTQLLTHGPAEVRRAPLDALFVNLQLAVSCHGEQDGRRCRVEPGSLAVFDTTRPYTLEFREAPGREQSWRVLSFRVPRDQWYSTVDIGAATSHAIDTETGVGRLVGAMMTAIWQERSTLDRTTSRTLEQSFADVLGAVAAATAGSAAMTEDERRDVALRRIVQHYIRTAIPLGRVTAEAAAREAAISVRTLHRLFEAATTTFAECVRQERLRGAMSDLESCPESVSVGEIAARWGFADTSHMTRTFQRVLGATPTQYRAEHTT